MTTRKTLGVGDPSTPASSDGPSAADVAQQAKSAATQAATDAAHSVAQTAKSKADDAKSSLANEVSGVASALRRAADDMKTGSPQERTFGQIAEGLADASDAVRDKDLSSLVQDVTSFARRNPMVFLSGAALVGFAATRFAKATTSTDTPSPVAGAITTDPNEVLT